jgi:uncharacterized membrane protein
VSPDRSRSRRRYIDWARGIAVLLMIGWHTSDAWTRAADRRSDGFAAALALAGFAAPLFLWLAGLGVALSAARIANSGAGRFAPSREIVRRGLVLFVLAFLFRVQAFIVTPGSHPVTIFRVDILNVMGPAIAMAGLVWVATARTGAIVAVQAALAATVAIFAPISVTMPMVDALPLWIQWYLRPAGDLTPFTMLPWAGFVFAGAACGALLTSVDRNREARQLHLGFVAAGLGLVAAGVYASARPAIFASSSFWINSPSWFAIRVGVLLLGFAALYLVHEAGGWRLPLGPLERFGQRSLFVYWIHVELVYGYASWPIRSRLPFWGSLLIGGVFTVLMYQAVLLRDRLTVGRQTRAVAGTPEGAPA